MRRLVSAVLVAAIAVACSEQSTAPNAGTPDLRAAQGDRSELSILGTLGAVDKSWNVPGGFWPCINGGLGEETIYWGPAATFWGKQVVTPSGNTLLNGYYRLEPDGLDHYQGLSSGDEWVSDAFAWNGKIGQASYENGAWMIHQTAPEDFTNLRTGERVRVLFQWNYHFAADGSVIGNLRNGKIVSCHVFSH